MGKLFDALKQTLFGVAPDTNGTAPALHVKVQCERCGEVIPVRVDKANDLMAEFADHDDEADEHRPPDGYTLHKEVVGRKCQNVVRFTMWFDDQRRATGRDIHGAKFVECENCD